MLHLLLLGATRPPVYKCYCTIRRAHSLLVVFGPYLLALIYCPRDRGLPSCYQYVNILARYWAKLWMTSLSGYCLQLLLVTLHLLCFSLVLVPSYPIPSIAAARIFSAYRALPKYISIAFFDLRGAANAVIEF